MKNVILIFGIEFFDFLLKPHLNRIKRCKVLASLCTAARPPQEKIGEG